MLYRSIIAITGSLLLLGGCKQNKATNTSDQTKSTAKQSKALATLRISALPDENSSALAERYKPLQKYLQDQLNIKVEFVNVVSYADAVEKFKKGIVQAAWFGGVTGVQARQAVKGAQAIISGKKDLAFKSYFVANAKTGLKWSEEFPKQIADLKFTYGSRSSTSGCIMPTHFLLQNTGAASPKAFFKKPFSFSGKHDQTAKNVQAGTYDAGVLNYSTYEKLVKNGTIDPNVCVKIWQTPTYADYNFTVHPILEEKFGKGFIAKLQQVLADCKDEAVLKALDRKQLVKVDNEVFVGIAKVLKQVKF